MPNVNRTNRRLTTAMWRGLRLRCPVCGQGRLFRNWIAMHSHCDHCGLKYERAPGYFLGSIYFNYGATTILVVAAFLVFFFTEIVPQSTAFAVLLAFSLLFPVWFFRYARSFWMAFDHFYDPVSRTPGTDATKRADGRAAP
ncbi:MAG: hypothetical protein DCC68_09325 [Planctomycetota bacterium]|nr:MAG: hypothetical protein DCC68_09325 [Planctomycetota bacterium]